MNSQSGFNGWHSVPEPAEHVLPKTQALDPLGQYRAHMAFTDDEVCVSCGA